MAVAYRVELWSSILNSPGFHGGFRHYWTYHRAVPLPHSPSQLPSAPPCYPLAVAIFDTFKACFDSFESWHVRQRCRLLRTKYESNQAIFQDIKPPQKPLLDLLSNTHEYETLAIDSASGQLHVHPSCDARGHSRWEIDGVPTSILLDEDQPDLCVAAIASLPRQCSRCGVGSASNFVWHWSVSPRTPWLLAENVVCSLQCGFYRLGPDCGFLPGLCSSIYFYGVSADIITLEERATQI